LLRLLTPSSIQELAMIRFALPVCMLAAIGMAGCTTYYDPPPSTPVTSASGAPVVTTAPSASAYRPGVGIVESISLVTLPASASAGGTAAPAAAGPYRVTTRMDDGSVQTILLNNRAFLVGDRVQVASDGQLVRQ
jgi:hypothetical protein